MKTLIVSLVALVLVMLVCAWLKAVGSSTASNKHKGRLSKIASAFMLGVQEVLCLPATLWQQFKHRKSETCDGANIAEGTHTDTITRKTDAAISQRHLLFKKGSDADHIAVCGASDLALGTVADEATAAEEYVAVKLLGRGATKRMVASEAIAAGVRVYQAASGKVATTGTKFVGTSITAASDVDDVLEVLDAVAGESFRIMFSGTHSWAGGAATTDAKTVTGLLSTDVVATTLRARNSTETLVMATPTTNTLTFTLSANGTNTTTKIDYTVFRAV